MKKLTVLTTLIAAMMSLSLLAMANENPFKINGEQVFWSKQVRTDYYSWTALKHDSLEGMTYAGATFTSTRIGEGGRVYFIYNTGEEFFFWNREGQWDVTTDPRESERWQLALNYCKAPTLWSRIQEGAGIEEFPADLTWSIIGDMVREGVTTWMEVNAQKMTAERIGEIMRDYTDLIED